MLSPLHSDGCVIVERAPPVWRSRRVQPESRRPQCRPPACGGAVSPRPTYYTAVYDVPVETCRDAPFCFGRSGRSVGRCRRRCRGSCEALCTPRSLLTLWRPLPGDAGHWWTTGMSSERTSPTSSRAHLRPD
ncbi:hypothetical protein COCON_G00021020, partial [Conger conger]